MTGRERGPEPPSRGPMPGDVGPVAALRWGSLVPWRRAGTGLALVVVLGACATAPPPRVAEPPRAAEPAPAPPAAPLAPPPSPRQTLAAPHRDRARQLEGEGQLRRARDEWKIALTIAPDDVEARNGLRALEARIEGEVTARVQEGRAALSRGVTVEARRKFLAALALDPSNKAAFEALQTEVREPEFIAHTVRTGDTLASLAQRYYGDRGRGEVIAETNQLTPGARLAAGTRLRIPEIPGVPFVVPEARQPQDAGRAPGAPPPEMARPGAPSPGGPTGDPRGQPAAGGSARVLRQGRSGRRAR